MPNSGTLVPYTDFGWALVALRMGHKVARREWVALGMDIWVVMQKGYPAGIPINKNTAEATGIPEGTLIAFRPYLLLKTNDGTFVPWTPSSVDVLAEDWVTVEEVAGSVALSGGGVGAHAA